jgi:hypothetical protein
VASATVIRPAAHSVRRDCLFIARSFGWPIRASVARRCADAQQVQQVTIIKVSLHRFVRHCEERSDEAIQFWVTFWIASP